MPNSRSRSAAIRTEPNEHRRPRRPRPQLRHAGARVARGISAGKRSHGSDSFGDPAHERVQLNDGTAWSGGTDSEERQQTIEADAAHHALAAARASLRAGRFDDATRWIQRLQSNYTQSYLPFGELLLDIAHSPTRLGGSSVGRCRR
ncbi:glycoside hydrolase N-terminal domain-containing protein [Micromonospora sp. NPDC023966]|uniref:glycoside hydrolase N-terminal domain-containing protein n=1 Tax=Micromonospora sp. NPDC023966 TaxID=3154699 RepID=UPI0033C96CE3